MSLELRQDAPVTWLASYPRSGNTLLRVILNRCFGLSSQSIYSDTEFSNPAVCGVVGHEPVGSDPRQFLSRARKAGRRLYVKTHELPPPDGHRAIYVIRDGRSAVVSHLHFLRQRLHRDVTLAGVIRGEMGISWSSHVRAWAVPSRSGTLVLRYEDLAAGDAKMLAALAAFVGAKQRQSFDISFDQLQALDPGFFRSGSDRANIAELDGEASDLFERLHGDTLRALGYGDDTAAQGRFTEKPIRSVPAASARRQTGPA